MNMLSLRSGVPSNYKPRKGLYRPVNQAGFRSLFIWPMGAKPRPMIRKRRHR